MQKPGTKHNRTRLLMDSLIISSGMLISLVGFFGNTIEWHHLGL